MATESEQATATANVTPTEKPVEKGVSMKKFNALKERVDYLYASLSDVIQYHGSKNGPVPPQNAE